MFRRALALCAVLVLASCAYGNIIIDLKPDDPGPYGSGEVVNVEAWFVDKDNGHPITHEDILFRRYQLDFEDTDPVIGLPDRMDLENPGGMNSVLPYLPRLSLIFLGLPNPPAMMTLTPGGEMLVGNLTSRSTVPAGSML